MRIEFKILKLYKHHNRGQFIIAKQLNSKEPLIKQDQYLLNNIPVYHYLEMYPFIGDEGTQFDIYVFRPSELSNYSTDYFMEGEIVDLII